MTTLRLMFLVVCLLVGSGVTYSPTIDVAITITPSATFPLQVVGGVLKTAGGTPYLILADAPQGANNLPLCKAGNTYTLCTGTGDTLAGAQSDSGQRTFLAYIKDRQAQGFNSLWINILCEQYTACNNDGSTQEGTYPFTTQLTAGVHSPDTCPENGTTAATPNDTDCWDMATVGNTATGVGITANGRNTETYWQHIDGYIKLANDLGMQILANPMPTDNCNPQSGGSLPGSFGYMSLNNNVQAASKITGYADFLTARYSKQSSSNYAPNLVWFLFNDYTCWNSTSPFGNYIAGSDNVFYAFASRLVTDEAQTGYTKHLISSELYGNVNSLSDNQNTWSNAISLNGVYYNSGPDYDGGLLSHVQTSTIPAMLVEGNYPGEDLSGVDADNQLGGTWITGCGSADILAGAPGNTQGNSATCPFRERIQLWKLMLTGAAGYLNGNTYTWELAAAPNWWSTGRSAVCTGTAPAKCLDIVSNAQLANAATFLLANSWYKIVPDVTRGTSSGFGTATAIASPFLTVATGCYLEGSTSHNCTTYYKGSSPDTATGNPKGDLFDAFIVSGAASDGSFGMAYVPGADPRCTFPSGATNCGQLGSHQVTFNNAKVGGGSNLTAAWYDPTGAMTSATTTICSPSGSACNSGSQTYTTPSSLHADGTGDWVLLVTGGTGGTQTPNNILIGGNGCSGATCAVPNIDDTFASNVASGLPPSGTYIGTLSTTLSAGTPPFSGSYSLVAHGTGDNCGTGSINNTPFQLSSDQLQYNTGATSGTAYNVCVKATVGSNSTTKEFTVTPHNIRNAAVSDCPGNGGGDGSSGTPWKDACIQAAINAASNGDTVFLAAGNWQLRIANAPVITGNKSVNLVGAGSGNAVDYLGHPNNGTGGPSGTNTRVYTSGTSGVGGGYLTVGVYGQNLGSPMGCANGSPGPLITHIYFDGSQAQSAGGAFQSTFTEQGDFNGTLSIQSCPNPTVDDIRVLSWTGGPVLGVNSPNTQFFVRDAANFVLRNSALIEYLSGSTYGGAQLLQDQEHDSSTITNDLFYQFTYNPIYDDNVVMSASQTVNACDGLGCPSALGGFGYTGCGIAVGCYPTYVFTGSHHYHVQNSYINSTGNQFGWGGGVNDPSTNGTVNDIQGTGDWFFGSDVNLGACAWRLYSACDPQVAPTAGMQINGMSLANTSLIGTTSAAIDYRGVGCDANGGPNDGTGPADCPGSTLKERQCVTCTATQNYLQGPSNQYRTDSNSPGASQTSNFCSSAPTTWSSGSCNTTGFNTTPTASFTLGALGNNGLVPFASASFTAQYGAVKWLASTSSTTPGTGDTRWSFLPPISLAATHGNTVYLWVMDSANHISAAASAGVP